MLSNVKNYFKKINQKSNYQFELKRLKLDIETFKANIKSSKEAEIEFYKNLLLESREKERIFGFRGYEKKEEPKVIVWDPLEGNLIISE